MNAGFLIPLGEFPYQNVHVEVSSSINYRRSAVVCILWHPGVPCKFRLSVNLGDEP